MPAPRKVCTLMLLSIVTVSYNQAAYLGQALDSVLSQDYPYVEYIVVDPGSTDGSRELLLGQPHSRLTRVILEPDEGPADGLNRGFELCTGQVFGYLNADDKYLPGTLASVAGQFGRHWDIDIIYGDGWTMDETGGRGRKVWSDPFDLRQYARGTSVILQQATFFRRRVWDAGIRFNRLNRTCWDGEFLVDAAFAGASFRHVRHDWGLFRVHPGSITGSGRMREQYAIDRARMAERILGRETTSYDRVMEQALRARKRLRRAYWTAAHIVRNEASS